MKSRKESALRRKKLLTFSDTAVNGQGRQEKRTDLWSYKKAVTGDLD